MISTMVDTRPEISITSFRLPEGSPSLGRSERTGRAALGVIAAFWLVYAGLLVAATVGHPVGSAATVWLRFDRLAAVLGLLVTTVGAVVTGYGLRYLRGDRRAGQFFVAVPATVASVLVMVSASNLVTFAVGWTLSEIGVVVLVGLYRPERKAKQATRATIQAFAIGDAALWAAAVVVVATWGNLDFHVMVLHPPAIAGHGLAEALLTVLVPLAVAARCALLPFARWLPATLAAPTPVSAFLHAGLVNAGGILLVRLAPLFGQLRLGGVVVFVLGSVSVVVATAAMTVESTIKGSLVRSTSAQMGFMVACCGLGWYTAAVIHLIAHGLYKATLFLGSGSAVFQHAEQRRTPPPLDSARRVLVGASVIAPAAAIAWAMLVVGPVPGREQLWGIAVLGWVTAARMAWGWARRLSSSGVGGAVVVILSGASAAYVLFAQALGQFLSPSIAGIPTEAAPVAAGLVVVILLVVLTAVSRSSALNGNRMVHRMWVWATWFGRPPVYRTGAGLVLPASAIAVPIANSGWVTA
jgi:NAD(P)H-quinone oxidoreductase subunit 5